jgi:hypothetical protein
VSVVGLKNALLKFMCCFLETQNKFVNFNVLGAGCRGYHTKATVMRRMWFVSCRENKFVNFNVLGTCCSGYHIKTTAIRRMWLVPCTEKKFGNFNVLGLAVSTVVMDMDSGEDYNLISTIICSLNSCQFSPSRLVAALSTL